MITDFQTYGDFISDSDNAAVVQAACATNYTYSDGTTIDEDGSILAGLIQKRYKYRRLGWKDPEEFIYYFVNNIETYKDQYMNLLHNQPGFADYDFTVQEYRERQVKLSLATTGKRTQGTDEDISNGSGQTTKRLTHGEIIDRTKDNTKTYTGAEQTADSGSDSDTHSGGYKDTTVEGKHTSEFSPHVKRVTQNGGHKSAWSGNQAIKADLPMQENSYTDFTSAEDLEEGKTAETQDGYFASRAKAGMPTKLDNSAATGQAQDYHNEYGVDKSNVTESFEYDDDGNGDITERNGDSTNPDITTREYDGEKKEKIYGKVQTRSFTGRQDAETETGKDTHSGEDITSGTELKSGSVTHSHGDITDNGTEESTNREIWTGRDLDLATLLTRAQAFIQGGNAWKWLQAQLDPCFLSNLE